MPDKSTVTVLADRLKELLTITHLPERSKMFNLTELPLKIPSGILRVS
jgi:hypothetical protein